MPEPSVLIASDSFKGCASSLEVADLIEQGVRRAAPTARVAKLAVADGGEGTLDAILRARGAEPTVLEVTGPLGRPVQARYGLLDDGTAVVEMAEAAGIGLTGRTSDDALAATTRGVGELILDAARRGARRVLVGLGGSATSDGGSGMARALGARLLDAEGSEVPEGLAGLRDVATVDVSNMAPELQGIEVVALSDVTNPLCGREGAVYVYGPQKGLPRERLAELDAWMAGYARAVARAVSCDFSEEAGAGAAGGLGFGLLSFCGARVEPGIERVLDAIRIDGALAGADLVITGEGRMDAQSAFGKAPVGVAHRAKKRGLPVVAVVGSRAADLGGVYDAGVDLVIPSPIGPCTLEECMSGAAELLPIAGEAAMRAFLL